MAWTQTQLDALRAAAASGVLTIEHDGRRLTNQSLADLLKAIAQAETALAAQANGGVAPTQSYVEFDRD